MIVADKASENFCMAILAYKERKFNAAANRLYYAMYHAVITELESQKPPKCMEDFLNNQDKKIYQEKPNKRYWWHKTIVGLAISPQGINLKVREKTLLVQAQGQRVVADYQNKVVKGDDLKGMFKAACKFLVSLNITVDQEDTQWINQHC